MRTIDVKHLLKLRCNCSSGRDCRCKLPDMWRDTNRKGVDTICERIANLGVLIISSILHTIIFRNILQRSDDKAHSVGGEMGPRTVELENLACYVLANKN